jgi:hypothetical protein
MNIGHKTDGMSERLRIFHNEELCDSHKSHSVGRIVKCRRVRWAGHVAGMGETRDVYRTFLGNFLLDDLLEDRERSGRMTFT